MIKRCAICDKEEDVKFYKKPEWDPDNLSFKIYEDLCEECKFSIEDALSEFYYDK